MSNKNQEVEEVTMDELEFDDEIVEMEETEMNDKVSVDQRSSGETSKDCKSS